ncbi:putative membrane protein [Bacillus phage SP-15]|uniref:Putative membrane protein n=1 Tax=Bacillus phage SP-15 TaxID=1792032 RepID=A0A127AWQ0_9CAUD|nr:hypothetical protein SP15_280 [Bacillus phage SP-15]AMM45088.1 putative membrane protein [Bacillus phage SP-15]
MLQARSTEKLHSYKTSTRKGTHLRLVQSQTNTTPVRQRKSIKSRIMNRLDTWADSISQKTFNRIMISIFGIVIVSLILLASHLDYVTYLEINGK